jgi:DNA-directed RNA polymerase specialized sigma24 family protein
VRSPRARAKRPSMPRPHQPADQLQHPPATEQRGANLPTAARSSTRPTSTREIPADRRNALAAFYARHHYRLTRALRARVHAVDDTVIADACAHAWLQLVRRPDINLDNQGLRWLTITATHEAWRLTDTSREQPAGSLSTDAEPGELAEPCGNADDPLALAIAHETHHQRTQHFADLRPRERRDLYLQALGLRYREIARATGSSYTAVNRRLTEGRAHLRRLERERGAGEAGEG